MNATVLGEFNEQIDRQSRDRNGRIEGNRGRDRERLRRSGASVVVNYSSSQEGADKVVAEIAGKGGKAIAVQADVSKSADVKRLFDEAKKAFGPVDVLVNNAGVYHFEPLEEVKEDEFHRQFNTNVLGLILTTQEAAKHFDGKGGSVINVGSVASSFTPAGTVVYTATKAAVDAVTRVLAKELGPKTFASTRSTLGA